MAGRYDYPKYDWRGIAMLTQQLGQLFEPSKAKLMSQQHEHEMGMLMAKKAWEVGSEQLEQLKTEHDGLVADLDKATTEVNNLGLRQLTKASRRDGANVEESAAIYESLDIKKLSDMQEMANKYRKMIEDKKDNLSNMILYNETAKGGQNFRAGSMQKKRPKSGVMHDYYEEANKDGIADLSFEEGQNAIKSYIKDNFLVAEDEGGMQMTFGSGDPNDPATESFTVKPEAIAFRAGWEGGTGTGTGRGKAEKGEISDKQAIKNTQNELLGGKTFLKMTDQELIATAKYNKQIFSDIDKNSGLNHSLGILLEIVDGQFVGTKAAEATGKFTPDNVIMYSASYTNYTKATQEMLKRGIEMPEIVNTGQYDSNVIKEFDSYGTHPDTLMSQISLSDKDDMEFVLNSYNDFLRQLPTLNGVDRRKGILTYQDWLK